ncbi:MAG: hypothetical protein EXX96DRAFT_615993 [Benjaminiella poitrasii]|nr:MAG: hypothetical protein EXX96DRAFT_615993 [Benjaminiella poitrasii]
MKVQVKILATMDQYLHHQLNAVSEITNKPLQILEEPIADTVLDKKKKKYTTYSDYDKMNFILHMLTKAPKKNCTSGCKKLNEEHRDFLVALLDKNLSTNVNQALDQLTVNFEGLKIGKSEVYNFIRKDNEDAIQERYA